MKLSYFLENQLKYNTFFQKEFFKRKISWDFPLSLNIEVTNTCNFNCSMCPRKKSNRGVGNMSFDLYKKIIDQIVQSGKKLYVLTLIKDGEPLLHPDLFKMISLAKEKKIAHRIEIFTNGSLLTEDISGKLINSGLDVLNVSVNAGYPLTHRKISGTNTFSLVVANLKNFVNLKKQVGVKHPLVVAKAIALKDISKEEINAFKRAWKGICDQVVVSPAHNYGGGLEESQKIIKRWPCLPLWFNPVINFDGKVTTCCANYLNNELIMGDMNESTHDLAVGVSSRLRTSSAISKPSTLPSGFSRDKQTLQEIWQSEKYKRLRQDHLQGKLADWPTCASCNYWSIFVNLEQWLLAKEKKI